MFTESSDVPTPGTVIRFERNGGAYNTQCRAGGEWTCPRNSGPHSGRHTHDWDWLVLHLVDAENIRVE